MLEGSLSDWEEVMIVALALVLSYVFVNDLVTESACLLMEFADDMGLGQKQFLQEKKGMTVINNGVIEIGLDLTLQSASSCV